MTVVESETWDQTGNADAKQGNYQFAYINAANMKRLILHRLFMVPMIIYKLFTKLCKPKY